jgi:hypothetical protein
MEAGGLRNIFIFYRALTSNTLWRVLTKKGMWNWVIKDKYFPYESVHTWLRSASAVTTYGSQILKNLIILYHLFYNGLLGIWAHDIL